jgi:hypothetical protein
MGTFIVLVLGLLTYANPILLVGVIVRRFARRKAEEPSWRSFVFWLALLCATAAVMVFWISVPYAPTAANGNEVVYQLLCRTSILLTLAALVCTLLARGRERPWVALSAVITPFSWFWALVMQ